ncbi:MAG: peptide-methionine (S)-S-oxide reductase MsrA [Elusimicrobia bacterium]|nr:peptide-methionine (S)-S-oxide reductase MsrA [Elusimicrobiota bacterium]MDE2424810.1 peptide-methionine (S)-S-oxide reductase MsrA [Elusimicrobiota bacterium]
MKRKLLPAALLALLPLSSPALAAKTEVATFAGGCFWCIQPAFDHVQGVLRTTVGYTGGRTKNPTYEQVSTGKTGHAESIEVVFNPAVVSYSKLLDVFWTSVDPTQTNGQFVDEGSQYRTVIFYHDAAQKSEALASKARLEREKLFGRPIVTQIAPASRFYPAEKYHQKYYLKHRASYDFYHDHSGREEFFKRTWGKARR